MIEPSFVVTLRQKIVDIEDAIGKYEHQIVLARQDLAAVSATLSIFTRPEGAPKSQEATFSVRKLYRRGEVATLCLGALQDAPGGLDTRELAAVCLEAKGYDPGNHVLKRCMAMTIVQFLTRLARKGTIQKAGMRETRSCGGCAHQRSWRVSVKKVSWSPFSEDGNLLPNFLNLMKRSGFLLLTMFNVSIGLVALWVVFRHSDSTIVISSTGETKSPEVEYKDYVVIVLTALGVMIAIGAAMIAFLAVFGYIEGMKLLERHVQRVVEEKLDPTVQRALQTRDISPNDLENVSDEELQKMIESLLKDDKPNGEGQDA